MISIDDIQSPIQQRLLSQLYQLHTEGHNMFCINHWLEKKSDSAIPSQDSYETI